MLLLVDSFVTHKQQHGSGKKRKKKKISSGVSRSVSASEAWPVHVGCQVVVRKMKDMTGIFTG